MRTAAAVLKAFLVTPGKRDHNLDYPGEEVHKNDAKRLFFLGKRRLK
jgi:hypothetical protein